MFDAGLRHTWLTGPWHYCARCDRKSKLRQELRWQRGLLLCNFCYDEKLLGDREPKIAMVLTDGKEELAPIEKLRNPDNISEADDFLG